MSRVTLKPRNAGRPAIRDAIWMAIRNRSLFTIPELIADTGQKSATVRDYVHALAAAGYIRHLKNATPTSGRGAKIWRLERDTGIEPPRITLEGQEDTSGRCRDQLWRAMKMLNDFDKADLALHASTEEHPVSVQSAARYISYLRRAGYLARIQPPQGRRPARYRLLNSKHTGPRAPRLVCAGDGVRPRVYDLNTGEYHPLGGAA